MIALKYDAHLKLWIMGRLGGEFLMGEAVASQITRLHVSQAVGLQE